MGVPDMSNEDLPELGLEVVFEFDELMFRASFMLLELALLSFALPRELVLESSAMPFVVEALHMKIDTEILLAT